MKFKDSPLGVKIGIILAAAWLVLYMLLPRYEAQLQKARDEGFQEGISAFGEDSSMGSGDSYSSGYEEGFIDGQNSVEVEYAPAEEEVCWEEIYYNASVLADYFYQDEDPEYYTTWEDAQIAVDELFNWLP